LVVPAAGATALTTSDGERRWRTSLIPPGIVTSVPFSSAAASSAAPSWSFTATT